MPTPRNEVVHLRPLAPGDIPVLASWAHDVAFCREADWSVDRPHAERVAFWRDLIQATPPDLIRLGVIYDGVLVGYVDLHGSEPTRRELGFVIGGRDRWGRGLGRRAAAAALQHAFQDLRLDEVGAQALDANQRSVRLLQRLGMRESARGNDGEFLGQPTFFRRFTITAAQWRAPIASPVMPAGAADSVRGMPVSALFDDAAWTAVEGFEFTDITYHRAVDAAVVRIAFDRPEVRNAFRPQTVDELLRALDHARLSTDVGCVLLTGNGPSPKDGGWAFCSGGDQRVRGRAGYEYGGAPGGGRLHILEVQRLIRTMPKVVVCLVPGWAAGGGHSLHVVCDLTLASAEHARFKQTDADVGSFDGGYGSAYLARQVGQKFAREIFFLGSTYDAADAHRMGMVNAVVPHAELERTALDWGRRITAKSPTAQRMLKFAFNAVDDGLVGQQVFAGEATRLAYLTDEAAEGRDAFLAKREPDWSPYPWQV